ncbi:restriction endonuclease subunit S [Ligilactobacillus murinus]|uniref:restriction endonuclease subunit S n=3 Tax=Ligilactobacillus murinus TaxID=1622 RepID=UPI001C3FCC87|nr:restriction endonuclease subunit S [Ligilactobacillus murinus]
MVEEKKNIPKVRFREFAGDDANAWELRKLGEVAKRYDNLRIPISEGKRERGNIPYYGANGIQDYVKGFTHQGEFVLVAEDGANDVINYPVRYVEGKIWVNNHAHVLQGKKDILDNHFLTYIIKSIKIAPFLVGGSRSKLNSNTMMNMSINVAPFREQQKIGTLFKHLDSLITLHQRELDNYKMLKKTMLSKMFPKNDEKYPEIRFTGFAYAWEQRKLGEIVEWSKGSGLSKDALNIQGIGVPVIHYADLYKFNSVQKEVIHWTMNDIGTKIPENNLLFPMSDVTPDGLARTSTVLQSNVKAGGDVLIAKLNKDILSTFMSYQINRNKNQILPLVTGTTVRHINSKSLSTLKVTVPGKNEQKYVGSILMRFDSLIALHQRELESLKTLKKNLLQQMFV